MSKSKFFREFAKLNKAQRQAVETIEGPVMVVAGPGTGKTQVVAMRIGQILYKTQLNPRNILALTFTEASVTALQKRLVELIGPEAYQVNVNTFHGFANEIITAFPYAFPTVSAGENLTELEQYRLLDELIVGNHQLKYLRPERSSFAHVKKVAEAIKNLKKEAVSPQKLQILLEKRYKLDRVSAKKKIKIEASEKSYKLGLELVEVYRNYQTRLRQLGAYDYEDMIDFVVEALVNEADIRSYLQERYQYILVDEYQDTNNAQNLLVERLADFFDNPNLFVVGDDKQAIFRFQGASVANMLHFSKKYRQLKVLILKDNYRNPKAVLWAASKLISHNRHQLVEKLSGVNLTLNAVNRHQAKVRLVAADNSEVQAFFITKTVKDFINAGLAPEQLAVLVRTNAEANFFRQILERSGLLVAGFATDNLIFDPPVQRFLMILRALNSPRDSLAVLAALPVIDSRVSIFDIVRFSNYRSHFLLESLLEGDDPVHQAARRLVNWQQHLATYGLLATVHEVVANSDLINVYKSTSEQLDALEMIRALLVEFRRFVLRYPSATVADLLSYFELLKLYQVNLPVVKLRSETKGIFVSTIHGAKGLEFDVVLMPNASAEYWGEKRSNSFIKLPGEITGLKHWDDDPVEDGRRLFYVAMTRARRELIFSYAKQNHQGNHVLPCQFVEEANGDLSKESFSLPPEQTVTALKPILTAAAPLEIPLDYLKYIREKIAAQPFSFTHLRTYQLCPRQYLLREVFRFPAPADASLVFGNAVHKALEIFFKKFRAHGLLPSIQFLLQSFMSSLSGDIPESELDLLRKRGERLLKLYFEKFSSDWKPPLGVEYNFTNHHVMLKDIWLTGKFDRIDLIDRVANTVRIVDYKTGSRAKTRGQIEGTTKDSEGEIKKQLVFYALLAALDRHFLWRPVEFQVSFIDDVASFRTESFSVEKNEIEALASEIETAFKKIMSTKSFVHTRDSFDRGCELCAQFPHL